jgi:hypothetical protein
MRVVDDLQIRPRRPKAVRNNPLPQENQNDYGGAALVATVWLAFYLLVIGHAVVSLIVSRAIELAAR